MIDAIEAYNMMPSVMRDEEYKEKLLKEIENKIIEAAKHNETSIVLQIPPDKFKLIHKELEKLHYSISNLSGFETESEYCDYRKYRDFKDLINYYHPVYNPKTNEVNFFYHISWNFDT